MPRPLITSGLPGLPAGYKDKDFNLVSPLYKAINGLAQQTSLATGNIQYEQAELAMVEAVAGLRASKPTSIVVRAAEALTYGMLLSLEENGNYIDAYKADNTVPARSTALAVLDTVGGLSGGQFGTALFMQGLSRGISGSILGKPYYLGAGGTVVLAKPANPQIVGIGMGAHGFYLNIYPPLALM